MDETLQAVLAAAQCFGELGVRWFVGGSLASSVHGIPRATIDADIIADLRPHQVKPLLSLLGDGWYADELAIRDAIANRSSFNLIHLDSAAKVDVFVPKPRRFEGGQFRRALMTPIAEGSSVEAPVCSAEDIVAAKLEWFRLGQETSERQWGDIVGVLRINAGRLDMALLHDSANELGVVDLLAKALSEAGHRGGLTITPPV